MAGSSIAIALAQLISLCTVEKSDQVAARATEHPDWNIERRSGSVTGSHGSGWQTRSRKTRLCSIRCLQPGGGDIRKRTRKACQPVHEEFVIWSPASGL